MKNLAKNLVIALIRFYQATLSPDHGWFKARHPHGFCRFYPSCSEFAKQAVTKYGVLKGLYLTSKRLLKCHPWAEPRLDLVP